MGQGKKEWISNLRVIATVCVVLLHVASSVLYKYNQVPSSHWWIGNVYDSLVRFSVPLFLMVSGALLLGRQYSYPIFLKRKVIRILLPFAFWTAIYIIYNFIELPQFNGKLTSQSNFTWILQQIRDGSSYHLWYVYMLLGIYIVIPLLAKLLVEVRKLYLELFLILWVLFITLSTSYNSNSNFEWNLWYYFGYLGYVVLGYYLSIINTKSKRVSSIAGLTFLIGLFITVYGTYYFTDMDGKFYKNYYSYLIPNVLLMAISVYVLLKNRNRKLNGVLKSVRNIIDKHSYGIYLSHILVLNYLIMYGVDWDLIHPLIGIPLTTIITLIVSVAIVYLIRKIPFGKYISG
jgi:surface polysaccharide O-acyltransferase-like enzyme